MDCGRNGSEGNTTPPHHSASSPGLGWTDREGLRNVDSGHLLVHLACGISPPYTPNHPKQTVSPRGAMLRQILLNSTDTPDFDLVVMDQTATHAPGSMNASHDSSVSMAALLRPTTGRGGGLREGEFQKPDLATYIVMCLVLFLLVLLIVFFINCQLRNSFFASMPYDRSLREARTTYK